MGWIARNTYSLVEWAGIPEAGWYFGLTALVMACIWVGVLYMVYLLVGNRTWDTILVAASPLSSSTPSATGIFPPSPLP